MADLAFELLLQTLNPAEPVVWARDLWLVDENIGGEQIARVRPRGNLSAVTNRYELYQLLIERGLQAQLSDFEGRCFEGVERVLFRVRKEKALVHHVLNRARAQLPVGGQLLISGYKKEGIKTYLDKTATLFGDSGSRKKGGQSSQLGVFMQGSGATPEYLDDKLYTELRAIAEEPVLVSKPGVFGWSKIDRGSAFLIEHLPALLVQLESAPDTVVDLGCGYGYISAMAHALAPAHYLATDNNVAAVAACLENFAHLGINGQVSLDNRGQSLGTEADLVLCNPPFHQGFELESSLTLQFLHSARRVLKKSGTALFVVNSFIPLEKASLAAFSDCQVLSNNGSFKLLVLKP
jgi:16S rRNA (guanine1207-N2)-methyltransferase